MFILSKDNLENKERRTVVAGHRGGFLPYNSMHAFRKAKDHELEAIELDIWVTKDDQLAVIHGGFDGEMPPLIGDPDDKEPTYVYNLTL